MNAVYIPILCLSAWLASYALLRLAQRLYRLLQLRFVLPAGAFALLSVIMFFIVVAAPAPVIVGAILLGLTAVRAYLPPIAYWGVPLIAAMCAASTLHLPMITGLPPLAVQSLGLIGIFGVVMAGYRLPDDFTAYSSGMLLTLLPLLAAPLLGAHSFVALDVGLIASALLGAAMAAGSNASMGLARLPLCLITGWLMLAACCHQGWVAAAISLLVYSGVIAYTQLHATDGPSHAL